MATPAGGVSAASNPTLAALDAAAAHRLRTGHMQMLRWLRRIGIVCILCGVFFIWTFDIITNITAMILGATLMSRTETADTDSAIRSVQGSRARCLSITVLVMSTLGNLIYWSAFFSLGLPYLLIANCMIAVLNGSGSVTTPDPACSSSISFSGTQYSINYFPYYDNPSSIGYLVYVFYYVAISLIAAGTISIVYGFASAGALWEMSQLPKVAGGQAPSALPPGVAMSGTAAGGFYSMPAGMRGGRSPGGAAAGGGGGGGPVRGGAGAAGIAPFAPSSALKANQKRASRYGPRAPLSATASAPANFSEFSPQGV